MRWLYLEIMSRAIMSGFNWWPWADVGGGGHGRGRSQRMYWMGWHGARWRQWWRSSLGQGGGRKRLARVQVTVMWIGCCRWFGQGGGRERARFSCIRRRCSHCWSGQGGGLERTASMLFVHLMHPCSCIIIWPLPVDNLGSGVVSARATIFSCKAENWHCSGTRGPLVWLVNIGGRYGCACASVSRGRVCLYLS
jgi:hypothetical protein